VLGPERFIILIRHKFNRSSISLTLKSVIYNMSKIFSITLNYNDNAQFFEIIDSVGRRISFVNDASGRIVSITLPHPYSAGERFTAMQFGYSIDGDLVKAADAKENSFIYKYKYHLLVQETNRNGLSFYFAYNGIDKDAQCVRTWGDDGIYDHVITYAKEKNITIVENSLGHLTTYVMDDSGFVVKNWRDLAGNIFMVERSEMAFSEYSYDKLGRVLSITHIDGEEELFTYREDGELIEAENSHTKVKFERNILGIIEKEWQNDHWVRSVYDKLDMRIEMQSSLGALQTIKRSIMGDVERMSYSNEHLSNGKPLYVKLQ
jgi:YD repeat-containing protein